MKVLTSYNLRWSHHEFSGYRLLYWLKHKKKKHQRYLHTYALLENWNIYNTAQIETNCICEPPIIKQRFNRDSVRRASTTALPTLSLFCAGRHCRPFTQAIHRSISSHSALACFRQQIRLNVADERVLTEELKCEDMERVESLNAEQVPMTWPTSCAVPLHNETR